MVQIVVYRTGAGAPKASPGGGASRSESNKRLPVAIAPLIISCRRRQAVTEEECGRKSYIFTFVEASSRILDFAVPLPTSLRSATFPPGEGIRVRRTTEQ